MPINRVTITGNLGADPELKSSVGGTAILKMRVAVNERRKDQSGEWTDYVNWIDAVMFGNRAESVSQYLQKGSRVAIDGRLHYSTWENEGKRHSKLEVVVDEIVFMSRSDSGAAPSGPNYGPMPAPPQNVVQAPPQVQQTVNDTFSSATPFNRSYPGGNFPQQQAAPELYCDDIPF